MAKRAQRFKVDLIGQNMAMTANVAATGDVLPNQLVQLSKIDFAFFNLYGFHTAADIHAYHSGNNFVGNRHRGADGAAHTCVYIGHNADFAVCKHFLVTNGFDLCGGYLFKFRAKTDGGVIFSFDFDHVNLLQKCI